MRISRVLLGLSLVAGLIAATATAQKTSHPRGRSYYIFGMHQLSPRTADSIYKHYGVRVVNSSCVLDPQKLSANKRTDSIMLATHHTTIASILRTAK